MGSYSVERSVIVKAPASRVHGLVDDFHGWTSRSPWEDLDPELERTYSGPGQGIGAHYAWSGNKKAGAGSMEITRSSAEEIVIALAFLKPFKSTSTTLFRFVPHGEETEVTWQMTGEQRGMMAVFGKLMKMDKLIGPDFEKGLARLKAAAEA
jgi:Polyketide cyclase / dehydrase and lipid transport